MAESRCPDCGAPTSPGAVVCASCGFPIRPDALPRAAGAPASGKSTNVALILVAVAAVGFIGVVVIGILAAIAIPRFTQASNRAKEREGELLLKWAFTAEMTYYAENGRFTGNEDDLAVPGKPASAGPVHYTLQISTDGERLQCLDAVPASSDWPAVSMDSVGSIFHAAGCSGEPYLSVPHGLSGNAGGEQIIREVYASVQAYRNEHAANPTTLPDVVTQVHDSPAGEEYEVKLVRSGDDLCAAAVPRAGTTGLAAYSVDQKGYMYQSAACEGDVIEELEPVEGDDTSATEPAAKEIRPIEKP